MSGLTIAIASNKNNILIRSWKHDGIFSRWRPMKVFTSSLQNNTRREIEMHCLCINDCMMQLNEPGNFRYTWMKCRSRLDAPEISILSIHFPCIIQVSYTTCTDIPRFDTLGSPCFRCKIDSCKFFTLSEYHFSHGSQKKICKCKYGTRLCTHWAVSRYYSNIVSNLNTLTIHAATLAVTAPLHSLSLQVF